MMETYPHKCRCEKTSAFPKTEYIKNSYNTISKRQSNLKTDVISEQAFLQRPPCKKAQEDAQC